MKKLREWSIGMFQMPISLAIIRGAIRDASTLRDEVSSDALT